MDFLKLVLFAAMFTVPTSGAPSRPRISCDSPYRDIFPEWFGHCGAQSCQYGDWSEWETVPDSILEYYSGFCPSGKIFKETRKRGLIVGSVYCPMTDAEIRTICYPTLSERLALEFSLGRSPDEDKEDATTSPAPFDPHHFVKRQTSCRNEQLCVEFEEPRGKRDLLHEPILLENTEQETSPDTLDVTDLESPIPFSFKEHGHRLKRQSDGACDPNDKKYVLFVLDTSGSIIPSDFNIMKETVATLTGLFCGDIKVAALSFDDELHLEFCFGCENNRGEERSAIQNIVHRKGWTHTGGATKCICKKMLHRSCGIKNPDDTCIDVIYITDGLSNDPTYEVCEAVDCLHNHEMKINTYSLGIGSAFSSARAKNELGCIQNSTNEESMFIFKSFTEFKEVVQDIESAVMNRMLDCHSCKTTCTSTVSG